MSKEVLIFLHMDDDHPGYIADYLDRKNIAHRVLRSHLEEPVPAYSSAMAGLIFMGGTMSANDDIPWITQEIALIRQAIAAGTPVLGHCLGGQLISRALGQKVGKNPVDEVGWHNCQSEQSEAANHWLGELESPFAMFHWHNETFELPVGAKLLFSSQFCKQQAYSYGSNVLSMQCHVEMTEALLYQWIEHGKQNLQRRSPSEQDYSQIRADTPGFIPELNKVADQLYDQWTATLDL